MIDTVPEFSFRKLLLAAGMFLRYVLNVDGKKYNNINIYAFIMERSIEGGNQEKTGYLGNKN